MNCIVNSFTLPAYSKLLLMELLAKKCDRHFFWLTAKIKRSVSISPNFSNKQSMLCSQVPHYYFKSVSNLLTPTESYLYYILIICHLLSGNNYRKNRTSDMICVIHLYFSFGNCFNLRSYFIRLINISYCLLFFLRGEQIPAKQKISIWRIICRICCFASVIEDAPFW